ncbi:MAG: LTA synthase family protein [Planctomycetota bacterium]
MRRFAPVASAIAVLWFVEAVARGSVVAPLGWVIIRPVPAVVNLGIIVMMAAFFAGVTGTVRRGALVALVPLALLAAIHGGKMLVLGEALYPWDLALARETTGVFGGGYFPFGPVAVGTFVVMLAAVRVPLRALPHAPIPWPKRCLLTAAMLAGLVGLAQYRGWPLRHVVDAVITDYAWDQRQNYGYNGLLLAFTLNMQSSSLTAPEGYGPDRMAAVVDRIVEPGSSTQPAGDTPPNLIVVFSESFWDPTAMPHVRFHCDPLAHLRSLQRGGTAFNAVSPAFGGRTCNPEFELLTGLPVSLLPPGAIPYQRFIRQPIPALPALLKDRGYTTIAIHPFHRWYWNRNNVYDLIGFDRSVFLADRDDWTKTGDYVSDDSLVDHIIALASEQTGPYFIFALSMQNHGPYEHRRFGDGGEERLVSSDTLSPSHLRTIEKMTRGLMLSDAALGRLADHFATAGAEPTVIVFLGDHLPNLGSDYDLYRHSGLAPAEGPLTPADQARLHTVPGVIWSNERSDPADLGTLSMMYVMPAILDRLAVADQLPITHWHDALRRRLPVWNGPFFQQGPDGPLQAGPPARDRLLDDGRLILYDLLRGEQHCREALFPPLPATGR